MLRVDSRNRLLWLGLGLLVLSGQPLVTGCATGPEGNLFISQLSLLPVSLALAKDARFPEPAVVPAASVHDARLLRSTIVTPVTKRAFARFVEQVQQMSPGDRSFFRFWGDFSNQGVEPVKLSIYFAAERLTERTLFERGWLIAEITLPPRRVVSIDGLSGFDTPPDEIERNLSAFIGTLTSLDAVSVWLVAESTRPFDLLATLSLIGMPPIHLS